MLYLLIGGSLVLPTNFLFLFTLCKAFLVKYIASLCTFSFSFDTGLIIVAKEIGHADDLAKTSKINSASSFTALS